MTIIVVDRAAIFNSKPYLEQQSFLKIRTRNYTMDEKEFYRGMIANSGKKYIRNRRNRNIVVWIIVSVVMFWIMRQINPESILSDIIASLILGIVVCFTGVLIITFINTQCFDLEHERKELAKLEKEYVEKFGEDDFYCNIVMKDNYNKYGKK